MIGAISIDVGVVITSIVIVTSNNIGIYIRITIINVIIMLIITIPNTVPIINVVIVVVRTAIIIVVVMIAGDSIVKRLTGASCSETSRRRSQGPC